jgi:hypothetical protein
VGWIRFLSFRFAVAGDSYHIGNIRAERKSCLSRESLLVDR